MAKISRNERREVRWQKMAKIRRDQRREVARRLRDGVIARNSEEAYVLLLSRIGVRPQLPAVDTYEDAMERLADLIDRPTCKNLANPHDGSCFECSECGERWELTCGSPADNHLNHCPNCGARIMEVAEDE